MALRKRFFHSYFIIIFLCTRIFFLGVSKLLIFPCKNTSCIFDIFIYAVIRRQKTLKPSHRRVSRSYFLNGRFTCVYRPFIFERPPQFFPCCRVCNIPAYPWVSILPVSRRIDERIELDFSCIVIKNHFYRLQSSLLYIGHL